MSAIGRGGPGAWRVQAAQTARLEINPISGQEVAKLIDGILAETSPEAVKKTKDILTRN